MDAEAVVEEVQRDAAAEVAAVAATGDAVIAAEVAEVAEDLAEHAELSEERHEEILEGNSWLSGRLNDVITRLDGLNTSMGTLATSQQLTQSQLQLLQVKVEQMSSPQNPNPQPSTDSTQSTPPEVEAVVVVETPTDNAPIQPTKESGGPNTNKPRRRRII